MEPDKNKDQHIMIDSKISARLVSEAKIAHHDVILEIGGGPGNLTELLADKSGEVYTIEKDDTYASLLKEKFAGRSNVKIISGNILEVDLPRFDKIVSNPPYQILQEFFYRLVLEKRQNFKCCVMTVPYGFAKLITKMPGEDEFGVLSALFYAFYDVEVIEEVPKGAFEPEPRVLSSLVKIVPKKREAEFLQIVFEYLFLHDTQKIKNAIIKLLWNRGNSLMKRKITKNDAKKIVDSFEGMVELLDKKIFQLSTEEVGVLSKQLLRIQS